MKTSFAKSSTAPTTPLVLHIQGLGHITSFKNSKMVARGRLMTAPIKQRQMESYILSIESQLRSMYQTSADGMQTGRSLASWIASSVPLDDSIQWVPTIVIQAQQVPKGLEGASIVIERL